MSFFTETIETQPMQTIREQCEKNQADRPVGEHLCGLVCFFAASWAEPGARCVCT